MNYFILLIFSLTFFSCVQSPVLNTKGNQHQEKKEIEEYYKQFCFYNGACTEYILCKTFPIKDGVKEHVSVQIERLNPELLSDSALVEHFLLSLEMYNLCSAKKNGCLISPITIDLFFSKPGFSGNYSFRFDDQNYITITGLEHLKTFNFKGKIIENKLNTNEMEILFEDIPMLKIECSLSYYESVLFPRYLNFISKNRRLTNYNLNMKKLKN